MLPLNANGFLLRARLLLALAWLTSHCANWTPFPWTWTHSEPLGTMRSSASPGAHGWATPPCHAASDPWAVGMTAMGSAKLCWAKDAREVDASASTYAKLKPVLNLCLLGCFGSLFLLSNYQKIPAAFSSDTKKLSLAVINQLFSIQHHKFQALI